MKLLTLYVVGKPLLIHVEVQCNQVALNIKYGITLRYCHVLKPRGVISVCSGLSQMFIKIIA